MQSNIQSVEEQELREVQRSPDLCVQRCVLSSASGISIGSDEKIIVNMGLNLTPCWMAKAMSPNCETCAP